MVPQPQIIHTYNLCSKSRVGRVLRARLRLQCIINCLPGLVDNQGTAVTPYAQRALMDMASPELTPPIIYTYVALPCRHILVNIISHVHKNPPMLLSSWLLQGQLCAFSASRETFSADPSTSAQTSRPRSHHRHRLRLPQPRGELAF